MHTIQKFEEAQIAKLSKDKKIDEFNPGDTIRVNVKIIEGKTERIQAFEGLCIGRKNRGVNSSFTVRKISHGEGVERVFPLYSPRIDSIILVRSGDVRRAKLYYIRERSGKSARIKEKQKVASSKDAATNEKKVQKSSENKAPTSEAKKEEISN